MWLFGLLLIVPIIEIALFIQIGGLIGLWPTLALVILTAVVGTAVMRSQGASAWNEVQRSFAETRDPSKPLAHGMMILLAGMLLVVPGFFTDSLGILLLIPPLREFAMRYLARRIKVQKMNRSLGQFRYEPHRPPYSDAVIDGEYEVAKEPRPDWADPAEDADNPPAPRKGSGWTRH